MDLGGQKREKFVCRPQAKALFVPKVDIQLLALLDSLHDLHGLVEYGLATDLLLLHRLVHVALPFALLSLIRDVDLLPSGPLFLVAAQIAQTLVYVDTHEGDQLEVEQFGLVVEEE